MTADSLVERELSRPDWSRLNEIEGAATGIPVALRELLSAQSAEDVTRAYWKLENRVVVQGQLFEAAIHCIPVLLAALISQERPRFVRIGILELMFQIVNGSTHEEEVKRGLCNVDVRCRLSAKHGLWLLYREVVYGETDAATDILNIIDGEREV